MRTYLYVSAATLLVAGLGTGSALAQLDADLGIVDAEVDVNTDDGIEADADVNVGGDDGADADADVNLGGDSAADADVDVNVGGDGGADASADAEVGGGEGLVDADADVNIGGDGNGGGGGGADGTAGDEGDVSSGGPATGGTPTANPPSVSGGTATGTDGTATACIDSGSSIYAQLANISYSSSAVANWANANSVAFVPVSICPGEDAGFASGLLAQAVASVPVLQSALSQSSYASGDIIGIVQQGSQLNVYVD